MLDFQPLSAQLPEVMVAHTTEDRSDWLLSAVQRLIREIELSDVSSSFAMEQIKYTTALPLSYA